MKFPIKECPPKNGNIFLNLSILVPPGIGIYIVKHLMEGKGSRHVVLRNLLLHMIRYLNFSLI